MSTPSTAAPKTMSMGASTEYSIEGAVKSTASRPFTSDVPSRVAVRGVGGLGSLTWTCWSVWSTAGLMTSSNGLGKNPNATMIAMSGARASVSRRPRSLMSLTPSADGPVATRWYHQRTYKAARTMPSVATTPATG